MALPVLPGGGIPAVPPAPPAVAAVAIRPRTYRELLNNAENGPAPGRIAECLQGYRFDGGGGIVPTPSTLRDQTIHLSDRQPMNFLCLVTGPGAVPEVTIVHRLMRYMDMPGEPASGYHDVVLLGLQRDILPHQYPAVEIPNTFFI